MKRIIGTSGWQYRDWRGVFYPEDTPQRMWLEFFAQSFDTVELNTSFYNMPKKEYFLKWKGTVEKANPDFVFSVKLYRLFTHYKRLRLDEDSTLALNDFCANASLLGKHLGPILIQLPPGLKKDMGLIKEFMAALKEVGSKNISKPSYSIEFRNQSWFADDVYDFLKKEKIALVVGDSPVWPSELIKTANFLYIRFHGNKKLFASEYSNKELKNWATEINNLHAPKAYIYFNNDFHAYAVKNARELKEIFRV